MSFDAWGPVSVVGRLGGGRRNEVLELRLGGQRVVGRVSRRSVASTDWELDLADLPGSSVPARAAINAWEAAAGWRLEPDYARSRLAALTRPDPTDAGG